MALAPISPYLFFWQASEEAEDEHQKPGAETLILAPEQCYQHLLVHAAQLRADLLVMGAYGHPRLFEFWVGGTTHDLLERAVLPVLMSH